MAEFRRSDPREPDEGLFARAELQKLMRSEFDRAQRYKYPLSVVLVAVDRLGTLHDLYGYDSKAQILGALDQLFRHATRESDALRVNLGDQILAVLPHTGPEGAQVVANRLLRGARKLGFSSDGRAMQITLSIGLAHNRAGRELKHFDQLVDGAMGALALATAAGGDRVVEQQVLERQLQELHQDLARQGADLTAVKSDPPPALTRLLNHPRDEGLATKLRELFAALGAGQVPAEGFEELVIEAASGGLEEARQRALDDVLRENARQVDLLERRIAKLTQLLGVTEQELKRVLEVKSVDTGAPSIYRTVQGLAPEEQQAEVKKELMAKIFQANLVLKERLAQRG